MPELGALNPVKHEGKRIAPGDTFTVSDPKEVARLLGNGSAIDAGHTTPETGFDLGDALQTLISEGHDVASMNMTELKKLLGTEGSSVKRADVDAALADIKSEAIAGQASTELVGKIVDAIKTLGPDALDENGAVDPAKVRTAFDGEVSDEAIAAAVAAMALTSPDSAGQ